MTVYAHRAAVIDRWLAEHGDPRIVAITFYGGDNYTSVLTGGPLTGVDYVHEDGVFPRATITREDVTFTTSYVHIETQDPA